MPPRDTRDDATATTNSTTGTDSNIAEDEREANIRRMLQQKQTDPNQKLSGSERTQNANFYEEQAKLKRGVNERGNFQARDGDFKGKEVADVNYKVDQRVNAGAKEDEIEQNRIKINGVYKRDQLVDGDEKTVRTTKLGGQFEKTEQYANVEKTRQGIDGKEEKYQEFERTTKVTASLGGGKRQVDYGTEVKRLEDEDGNAIKKDGREQFYREKTVSKFDKEGNLTERYDAKELTDEDGKALKNYRGQKTEIDKEYLDKTDYRGRRTLETKENSQGEREVTKTDYHLGGGKRSETTREIEGTDEKMVVAKEVTRGGIGATVGTYKYTASTDKDGNIVENRERTGAVAGNYTKTTTTTQSIDENGEVSAKRVTRTDGMFGERVSTKDIDLKAIKELSEQDVKEKAEAYIAANKVAKDHPELEKAKELVDKTRDDFKNAAEADSKAFPHTGKDQKELAKERMEDAFTKASQSEKTRDDRAVETLRENISKEDSEALKKEAVEKRDSLREEAKELLVQKETETFEGKSLRRQVDSGVASVRGTKDSLDTAVDEKLDRAAKLSDTFEIDVKDKQERAVEGKEGKKGAMETSVQDEAKEKADEILIQKLTDAKIRRSEIAEKYGSIQGMAEHVPGEARNAKLDEEKYTRAAEGVRGTLDADAREKMDVAVQEETTKRISKQAVSEILNPDHERSEDRGVSPQSKVAERSEEIRQTGRTADRAARTDETSVTEDMSPAEQKSYLQQAKDWANDKVEAAGKQLQSAREYVEKSFANEQSQTRDQLKLDERQQDRGGLAG